MNTDDTFFLRIKGEISGPYSRDRLRLLITRGRINRHYEISNDQSNWHLLAEETDLFDTVTGIQKKVRTPQLLTAEPSESSQTQPEIAESGSSVAQYFYHHHNQTVGPTTLSQLTELVNTGQLPVQTQICPAGTENWQSYESAVGMISSISATPKKSRTWLIVIPLILLPLLAFVVIAVVVLIFLIVSANA